MVRVIGQLVDVPIRRPEVDAGVSVLIRTVPTDDLSPELFEPGAALLQVVHAETDDGGVAEGRLTALRVQLEDVAVGKAR